MLARRLVYEKLSGRQGLGRDRPKQELARMDSRKSGGGASLFFAVGGGIIGLCRRLEGFSVSRAFRFCAARFIVLVAILLLACSTDSRCEGMAAQTI